MAEDPYPVPLFLASPHWPRLEAGGLEAEGLEACGPGVGDQEAGSLGAGGL